MQECQFLCYNGIMEDKIQIIKNWLGTGSINIFGLPMSGKDTQGVKLAEALNAKLLSSGMIIRAMEKESAKDYTSSGALIPTNVFYNWVLPYFERRDLFNHPLILSSIGRWSGEEDEVMSVAAGSGHEIKAVILLNIPESETKKRFYKAKELNDRGNRSDDQSIDVFNNRLQEFKQKTLPVLEHYHDLGLLITVNGNQSRDAVFDTIIDKLVNFASKSN